MDLLKLASRRALAFALALFVLCLTPAVSAQGFKWWQDDTYKRELGLTTEQSTRLEDIFQKSAPSLRQLKEKLDKAQVAFDRIVERGDDSTVLVQVDALEGARSELNKARVMMLLRMRRTLTADQWAKFTALNEQRERERERQGNRR